MDRFSSDFVKENAMHGLTCQFFLQQLGEVPGNGFAFPVMIAGQIQSRRVGKRFAEFFDDLGLLGVGDVFGLEVFVNVDAEFFRWQVTDMSH